MDNFKRISDAGLWVLWLSAAAMVVSLLISFVFYHQFSLTAQIISHIVTIVAAGTLKLGYVAYIAGRYQRGLAI